jgi:hypothetical protein
VEGFLPEEENEKMKIAKCKIGIGRREFCSVVAGVFASIITSHAHIPPPETFNYIKTNTDLIALIKVRGITEVRAEWYVTNILVSCEVIDVFHGRTTNSLVPLLLHSSYNPRVGTVYYAFLKRDGERNFIRASYWWGIYRVEDWKPLDETKGRRVHHSDACWLLTSDTASRRPYRRKATNTAWPVIHIVASGDSMSRIAKHYYGDSSRWRRISWHNVTVDDQALPIGSKVVVPTINDYEYSFDSE